LPAACESDAACPSPDFSGWQAGCILADAAGPGRVGGCAVRVGEGEPCASHGAPCYGQVCPEGTVCGAMSTTKQRLCEAAPE
jgi:hypothetical protein